MAAREQWRAQLTTSSGGGGTALDELTSELGLEAGDYARLGLRLAGQRVQVSLERRSRDEVGAGEVEGVVLSVKFEGKHADTADTQPNIVLRRERDADVQEKDRGLTVGVQTGYPGFDHAVFIDNDSSEADVRRILRLEATRQAVLRLLDAGHAAVRISTTGVTVRQRVKGGVVRAAPVLDALEDLLIVSRAGGPRDAAPPKRGELVLGLAVALCTAAIAYAGLAWAAWPTSFAVSGIGLIAGAIVAFFARPSVETAMSGDSSSGRRAALATVLVGFTVAGFVFGGLEHANGALDDSKGKEWRGVITATSAASASRHRSTDRHRTLEVRWSDGSTERLRYESGVSVGDHVFETRHPGALGFPWFDGRRFVTGGR